MGWEFSSIVSTVVNQKADASPSFPFDQKQINDLKIVSSQLLGPVLAQVLSCGFLESFITRRRADLSIEISGLQHELAQTSNYNLTRITSLKASIFNKETQCKILQAYLQPKVGQLNTYLIALLKNPESMAKFAAHPLSIKIFEFIKDELVKPEMSSCLTTIVTIMDKVLSLNSENNVTGNAMLLSSLWRQILPLQKMIIARITDDDIELLFRDLIDPILCSANFWPITRTAIETFYVGSLQDYRNKCRDKTEELSELSELSDDFFDRSAVTVPSNVFKENKFPGDALNDLVDDFFTFFINKKLLEERDNNPIKKMLCDNLKQENSQQFIFLVQLICLLLKINPSEQPLVSPDVETHEFETHSNGNTNDASSSLSSDESDRSDSDLEQDTVEFFATDVLVTAESPALRSAPISNDVTENTSPVVFRPPVYGKNIPLSAAKFIPNLTEARKYFFSLFSNVVIGDPLVMRLPLITLSPKTLSQLSSALWPVESRIPQLVEKNRFPLDRQSNLLQEEEKFDYKDECGLVSSTSHGNQNKYEPDIEGDDWEDEEGDKLSIQEVLQSVDEDEDENMESESDVQGRYLDDEELRIGEIPAIVGGHSHPDVEDDVDPDDDEWDATQNKWKSSSSISLEESKATEKEEVRPNCPGYVQEATYYFNYARNQFMAGLNESISAEKNSSMNIRPAGRDRILELFNNFCNKVEDVINCSKTNLLCANKEVELFDENTLFICNDIARNKEGYVKIIQHGGIEQYIQLYNRLSDVKNKSSAYVSAQEKRLNTCCFFRLFMNTALIEKNRQDAENIKQICEGLLALLLRLEDEHTPCHERLMIAKNITVLMGADSPPVSVASSGCLSLFQRKHITEYNVLKHDYELILKDFKAVAEQVKASSPAAA